MKNTELRKSNAELVLNGIIFPVGIQYSYFPNSEKIEFIILKTDTIVNGLLFKAGTRFNFYDNGAPRSGTLARNETCTVGINIFTFSIDTRVIFSRNGLIIEGYNLLEEAMAFPPLMLGEGLITFNEYQQPLYFTSGRDLNFEGPSKQKFTTKSGSAFSIKYLRSNKPSLLSSSLNVDNIKWDNFILSNISRVNFFPPNAPGPFEELGSLRAFTTQNQLIYQGYVIAAKSDLLLYLNGNLERFLIAHDTSINGINLQAKTTIVDLFEDGKLRRIISSHAIIINGVEFRPHSQIKFDVDGNVVSPKS